MGATLAITDAQCQQYFRSPLRLFYSYSHRDERLLDKFRAHLSGLRREGVLQEWHDRRISAGSEWHDEINEQLEAAHIVLLLVSADFLASDYIQDRELRRALEKHAAGQARVIPVILRPVDNWQAGQLGRLQALPTDGKAVTTWDNRDEAWSDVVRGIRKVVAELTTPPPEPLRPADEPERRQPLADASVPPSPEPVEDGRLVGTAIQVLARLMQAPAVRDAVSNFREEFNAACDQIRVLSAYKGLHDRFQQLEDSFKLIYLVARRLPSDGNAWIDLEVNEPEVDTGIDDLLSFAARTPFARSDALWIQQLDRSRAELRDAVVIHDPVRLTAVLRKVNEVLARQPYRINDRLVTMARNLRLSDLAEAMTTLRDGLARLDSDREARLEMEQFEGGVDALTRLDHNLQTMVDDHDSFQTIDNELRRVEALLDQDVGEASRAWQDLGPMAQALGGGNDAGWATKLGDAATELELALMTGDPVAIKRSFRLFRSQANRSFHQVDQDLLSLCDELRNVGVPLSRLLQQLQND